MTDVPNIADDIDEIVWLANGREERGLTSDEIEEELRDRGADVSSRKVQYALTDMVEAEILYRQQAPSSGSPGRPPMHYYHPDHYDNLIEDEGESTDEGDAGEPQEHGDKGDETHEFDLDDDVTYTIAGDRGEKTEERERDEAENAPTEFDLVDEIKRQHLDKSDVAKEIRAIAPEFLETDPRDLILELTEWTVQTIDGLSRALVDAHDNNQLRREQRIKSRLEGLHRFVDWYLRRIYRLDYPVEGTDEIIEFPAINELYDHVDIDDVPEAAFDRQWAEERLDERVFGENVLEVHEITEVSSVAGTDSSIAEVGIPNPRDPLVRKTQIDLFTGAAALQRESVAYTDYDFDPETLRRSSRQDAFRNGLMSSGRIRGLTDSQRQKSRYAALDLRMYNQTIRVVTDRANWEPVGKREGTPGLLEPDVIYGDGRVMPLVHQISDYASRGLYGDLSRNEIRRFAELVSLIDEENTLVDSVFAGIVKQSNLTWLAPLVFYYLNIENGEKDDPVDAEATGEEVPDEIYQPPINDPVVTHLLADGLVERELNLDEDSVIVTFRVMRQFYDQSLDRDRDFPVEFKKSGGLVDVDSEEDWQQFFEEFVEDREERGYRTIEPREFKHFRNLCANAGTVMAYAAPRKLYEHDRDTTEEIVLPRIEVATSPAGPAEDQILTAVSGFASTYDVDEAHAIGAYSTHEDTPVLVPSVIKEADLAAKFLRDGVGRRFEREFRELVAAARESNSN